MLQIEASHGEVVFKTWTKRANAEMMGRGGSSSKRADPMLLRQRSSRLLRPGSERKSGGISMTFPLFVHVVRRRMKIEKKKLKHAGKRVSHNLKVKGRIL